MSNPYLNNILFGNSKASVDEDYICSLGEFMLTEDWLQRMVKEPVNANSFELSSPELDCIPPASRPEYFSFDLRDSLRCAKEISPANPLTPTTSCTALFAVPSVNAAPELRPEPRRRYEQQKNSLFWSIYEIENPKEAFMGTRANAEVEHRLKVVASLKQTPKRLKETNSKLTIEKTQALIGSMLVAKEDQLDFCIAYAVYYCKPIVVVYPKTYRVFSPTVDVDLADEDVILLYVSKPDSSKSVFYESEKNATPELVEKIVETRVRTHLAAMSTYKAPELDAIAAKLNIETNVIVAGKEKRRKKEDIYNDILVATHNDANFLKN